MCEYFTVKMRQNDIFLSKAADELITEHCCLDALTANKRDNLVFHNGYTFNYVKPFISHFYHKILIIT